MMFMIWLTTVLSIHADSAITPPAELDLKANWNLANTAYKEGDYEQAFSLYEAVFRAGVQNGPLLFNMGNACYKRGKLGPAILYYEKALAFMPRDENLAHNLKRALAARSKAKTDPNDDLMTERIRKLFYSVSYPLMFWMTGTVFILISIGWFLIFWKGLRAQIRVAVFSFSLLGFLMLGWTSYQYHLRTTHDRGVVLSTEESVRSGPSSREDVSFTIYEGKRVIILARTPGWLHIRLNNGYNGWVPEDTVGVI